MFALDGIRVLDLSHYIAGPHCSLLLADHGAEVIKLEPLSGEPSRHAQPVYDGQSLYFTSMNRNKKSLAIDLKRPEARPVVDQLVSTADLVVTNYSKGVPERLHFDYDRISKINPRIIMVQVTGFGLTGHMSDLSAFDGIIQALSGISYLTGERDGPPLKAGAYIADHAAGLHGALGALLALQHRERTGVGQLVDVSMLDSIVAMLAYEPARAHVGMEPARSGNRSANVFATTFRTRDGYVYIAALSERMWTGLAEEVGTAELADPRYLSAARRVEDYDSLEKAITAWTTQHSSDEIVARLQARGVPTGKVSSIDDLLASDQLADRDMLPHVRHGDGHVPMPGRVAHMSAEVPLVPARAPGLGADTMGILTSCGFETDEIDALAASGVVSVPASAYAASVGAAGPPRGGQPSGPRSSGIGDWA
ncbi:CaiB/BaiF CoA transferase family protein [Georgenia ruanii]|uniref:CoA transferase n=1 Tax=Georgenia ruanii TaxID=348442 RepID=A0A7J9USN0_9MICO|nr:CoA transferase [Georgenia ruanii]MPV87627.1 CoA transferase [Georgenia ruanii]